MRMWLTDQGQASLTCFISPAKYRSRYWCCLTFTAALISASKAPGTDTSDQAQKAYWPGPDGAAGDGVLQRADAVEHVEEHLADEDDGEEREHRDGEDRLGVHDLLKSGKEVFNSSIQGLKDSVNQLQPLIKTPWCNNNTTTA